MDKVALDLGTEKQAKKSIHLLNNTHTEELVMVERQQYKVNVCYKSCHGAV